MTKGQIEAAVTQALTKFEREHLGRGPRSARSHVVQDMVLVRLGGILSPAEKQLSLENGGADLIKQMRSRLVESSSHTLKSLVESVTGLGVVTMHTDISSRTGERIFVFVLEQDLEATLSEAG